MAANGIILSPKKEKALSCLMSSSSVIEAAKKAGLGHRTLMRWLSEDDDFKSAYLTVRRQGMSHTIAMLQQSTGEAVTALREVTGDPDIPANARVGAAKVILELAMKALEVEDLERRISALEAGRPHTNGRVP
jgi:hypothetical protein